MGMKRLISRLAIAAVGASTIGVVVGATPAFAVKSCTGTLTGDVNSSVVVPANAVCTLQNAAVHGSVTVSANGALLVKGSTIDASLNATSPKWIGIETFGAASQVAGGITITGTSAVPPASAANFICGATTGGSLSLKNSKATAPYDIGGGVCGSGNTFGARAVMQGNASTIRCRCISRMCSPSAPISPGFRR